MDNPFKIWDELEGDFEVEEAMTKIIHDIPNVSIEWKNEDDYVGVLTLNEMFEQVMVNIPGPMIPYIRVGNYKGKEKTWIVHGITKGYS